MVLETRVLIETRVRWLMTCIHESRQWVRTRQVLWKKWVDLRTNSSYQEGCITAVGPSCSGTHLLPGIRFGEHTRWSGVLTHFHKKWTKPNPIPMSLLAIFPDRLYVRHNGSFHPPVSALCLSLLLQSSHWCTVLYSCGFRQALPAGAGLARSILSIVCFLCCLLQWTYAASWSLKVYTWYW
jgi:hypothetical protein